MENKSNQDATPRAAKVVVNTARAVLAVAFLFSGFVKAIDPLGTQYKFQDYLAALDMSHNVADWMTLTGSILLSATEMVIGFCLLLAIARRMTSRIALAFMAVMTAVTVWIFFFDPVKDCGCFGDAIVLSNTATLLKNIFLLAAAAVVAWRPLYMPRLFSKGNQWLLFQASVALPLALSLWCLYDLPLIDFRPYHVGADIRKGMEIPDGAEMPEVVTTFILEKDGVRKEFTLEDYPDSTWTFIDSKTVTVKEGYVPPIHDFFILNAEGEDITENVLAEKGYVFLLVSPSLRFADDQNFGDIDQIYEFCHDNGIPFLCLTASDEDEINHWQNITGAEYPFCFTDAVTLKTVIRSNPGLVVLKDGKVAAKWSHNRLPDVEELRKRKK